MRVKYGVLPQSEGCVGVDGGYHAGYVYEVWYLHVSFDWTIWEQGQIHGGIWKGWLVGKGTSCIRMTACIFVLFHHRYRVKCFSRSMVLYS